MKNLKFYAIVDRNDQFLCLLDSDTTFSYYLSKEINLECLMLSDIKDAKEELKYILPIIMTALYTPSQYQNHDLKNISLPLRIIECQTSFVEAENV